MMHTGTLAVALVQRQVMIVQAARSHSSRDRWLDVYTYVPFGDRVFLAQEVPNARISARDILTIFPASDAEACKIPAQGMLELPKQAFSEFMELRTRNQKRSEDLFAALVAA